MFGYEDHEMPYRAEEWQKICFPEDRNRLFGKYQEHVDSKGKVPFYNEIRYHHKNGSTV
jgi:hypothetical protein